MVHVALEFVRLFGGGKRGKGWEREVLSNCAYAPLTVCSPFCRLVLGVGGGS